MEFFQLVTENEHLRADANVLYRLRQRDPPMNNALFIDVCREQEAINVHQSGREQAGLRYKRSHWAARRLEAVKRRAGHLDLPRDSFSRLSIAGDSLISELLRGLLLEDPQMSGLQQNVYPAYFFITGAYGRSYSRSVCSYLTPVREREKKATKNITRARILRTDASLSELFYKIGHRLEKATFPTTYRPSIWTIALTFTTQLRTVVLNESLSPFLMAHLGKYSSCGYVPNLLGRHLTSLSLEARLPANKPNNWTSQNFTEAALLLATVGPQLRHLRLNAFIRNFGTGIGLPVFTRLRSLSLLLTNFSHTGPLLLNADGRLERCFPWDQLHSLHLTLLYDKEIFGQWLLQLLTCCVALQHLSLRLLIKFDTANSSVQQLVGHQLQAAVNSFAGNLSNLKSFRLMDATYSDIKQAYGILSFLPIFTPLIGNFIEKLIIEIPTAFTGRTLFTDFHLNDFKVLKTLILCFISKESEKFYPLDFLARTQTQVISHTVTSLTIKKGIVRIDPDLSSIGKAFPILAELNIEKSTGYQIEAMVRVFNSTLRSLATLRFLTPQAEITQADWPTFRGFFTYLHNRSARYGFHFTFTIPMDESFRINVVQAHFHRQNKAYEEVYPQLTLQ